MIKEEGSTGGSMDYGKSTDFDIILIDKKKILVVSDAPTINCSRQIILITN